MNFKNLSLVGIFLYLAFISFFIVSYIMNIVKIIGCDFEASYKEEIIHAIGIFVPPLSMITAWI